MTSIIVLIALVVINLALGAINIHIKNYGVATFCLGTALLIAFMLIMTT